MAADLYKSFDRDLKKVDSSNFSGSLDAIKYKLGDFGLLNKHGRFEKLGNIDEFGFSINGSIEVNDNGEYFTSGDQIVSLNAVSDTKFKFRIGKRQSYFICARTQKITSISEEKILEIGKALIQKFISNDTKLAFDFLYVTQTSQCYDGIFLTGNKSETDIVVDMGSEKLDVSVSNTAANRSRRAKFQPIIQFHRIATNTEKSWFGRRHTTSEGDSKVDIGAKGGIGTLLGANVLAEVATAYGGSTLITGTGTAVVGGGVAAAAPVLLGGAAVSVAAYYTGHTISKNLVAPARVKKFKKKATPENWNKYFNFVKYYS